MVEYKDITTLKKEIADFKRCVDSPSSDYLTGYICALSVTEGIIASLPTADVVEVVRCKDCNGYDKHRKHCNYCGSLVFDDDFCSYGKRKEGVDND